MKFSCLLAKLEGEPFERNGIRIYHYQSKTNLKVEDHLAILRDRDDRKMSLERIRERLHVYRRRGATGFRAVLCSFGASA
jgi:hypothetical protein